MLGCCMDTNLQAKINKLNYACRWLLLAKSLRKWFIWCVIWFVFKRAKLLNQLNPLPLELVFKTNLVHTTIICLCDFARNISRLVLAKALREWIIWCTIWFVFKRAKLLNQLNPLQLELVYTTNTFPLRLCENQQFVFLSPHNVFIKKTNTPELFGLDLL